MHTTVSGTEFCWDEFACVLVQGNRVEDDDPIMRRPDLWAEVCRLLHEHPRLRTTLTVPDEFASAALARCGYRLLGAPPMDRGGMRQLRLGESRIGNRFLRLVDPGRESDAASPRVAPTVAGASSSSAPPDVPFEEIEALLEDRIDAKRQRRSVTSLRG